MFRLFLDSQQQQQQPSPIHQEMHNMGYSYQSTNSTTTSTLSSYPQIHSNHSSGVSTCAPGSVENNQIESPHSIQSSHSHISDHNNSNSNSAADYYQQHAGHSNMYENNSCKYNNGSGNQNINMNPPTPQQSKTADFLMNILFLN